MTKILKEGLSPLDRLHTTTCRSCGTNFQFQESEGHDVQGWGKHEMIQIPCPLPSCGKPQYLYVMPMKN